MLEEFAALQKQYNDQMKVKRDLQKHLEDFLAEEGFYPLWESDVAVCTTMDWGHSHGANYEYGTEMIEIPNAWEAAKND